MVVDEADAPLRGRRVLITGGGGFVGRRLAAILAKSGAVVTAADAVGAGLLLLQTRFPRIQCFELDIRDQGAVRRVVNACRPEYVFHLAAAGVTDPFLPLELALEVNLYGTLNLFRACFDHGSWRGTGAAAGVVRLVHSSTPYEDVLGDEAEPCPNSHYAASKAAATAVARMFCRTQGWPIVLVRPFQVYGPGQRAKALIPAAVAAATERQPFRMTGGEQERDFIYVDDIVRGLIAAAARGVDGRSYDLGWGRTYPVRAVIARLYELIDAEIEPLYGALPYRPGEIWNLQADTAPATRDLGWYPQVPLDEGLVLTAKGAQNENPLASL